MTGEGWGVGGMKMRLREVRRNDGAPHDVISLRAVVKRME